MQKDALCLATKQELKDADTTQGNKNKKQTFFTMRNNNKNMKLPTRSLQSRVKSMLMSMPANVAIVSCAPCQGVCTGKSGTLRLFASHQLPSYCSPPRHLHLPPNRSESWHWKLLALRAEKVHVLLVKKHEL